MPEVLEQGYIKHKKRRMPQTDYSSKYVLDNIPDNYPAVGWDAEASWNQTHKLVVIASATSGEKQESIEINWPGKKNPFTQFDLVDSEDEEINDLIYRIKTSTAIPSAELLANRLIALFNDAKEEDPGSIGISLGSLRNFYTFLHLHENIKHAIISLTPDNNIYASWSGEEKRIFSVIFLSNRNVCFVIFKPNSKHPEQQDRISGTTTNDILAETVAPDWVFE